MTTLGEFHVDPKSKIALQLVYLRDYLMKHNILPEDFEYIRELMEQVYEQGVNDEYDRLRRY